MATTLRVSAAPERGDSLPEDVGAGCTHGEPEPCGDPCPTDVPAETGAEVELEDSDSNDLILCGGTGLPRSASAAIEDQTEAAGSVGLNRLFRPPR